MIKLPAKTRNYRNFQLLKGFTLIELLIVIAILGGLATMVVVGFPAAQRRARDARRRTDLKQYQVALETYANANNGFYPGRTGIAVKASDATPPPHYLCTDLGLSGCPADPRDSQGSCHSGQCMYFYQGNNCNDGTACATQYTLRGRLEQESGHWIVCSNGRSGMVAEGDMPLSAGSEGDCPL